MGYFPLPELKGKPNRIFVDGKTLNQIAKESGIRLDTVQHRYSRGIRDYEGLTKPSHIRVEHEKAQRKTYSIMSAGERVMERIWELDIPLQTISDKTGISRSTIYAFLYNGTDLSSMRLAKICSLLGLSMDYVMGLKEKPDGTVKYHDNDRYYCIKWDDPNLCWHNGFIGKIYSEMFPLTMPYMPSNKADVIVCDELLTDRKNGDFDTLAVLYIQRSHGEKVEVNRYFKEGEKSFIEISPEEYEERKKMHEKRQEQEDKAQDEN